MSTDSTTLFGYSVQENEGQLVITVHGTFAETALKHLRGELTTAGGLGIISRLSPVGTLGHLISRHQYDEPPAEGNGEGEQADAPLEHEQIFNQGVDQSLVDFEREMAQFQQSLTDLHGDTKKQAGASAAVSAKKKD